MLQRIQTLYLLAVALTAALFLFLPISIYKVKQPDGNELLIKYDSWGLHQLPAKTGAPHIVETTLPVTVTAFLIIACALLSVFLFKRRRLQLMLGNLNMLLLSGLVGLVFFYADNKVKIITGEAPFSITYLGAYLPALSLILTFLANKAIKKDEELVRSADRIR